MLDDDNNSNNKATQSHYNCGNDPIKRALTRLRCAKGYAAKKTAAAAAAKKASHSHTQSAFIMKKQVGGIDLIMTTHIKNSPYTIVMSREQQTTRLN